MVGKLIKHEFSDTFDTLEIYPLMDLHIGDAKTDEVLFHKFIQHILEQPNRYITIQGDLMNNATKSSVSNVYEETMPPQEQKKWLIGVVKNRCNKVSELCLHGTDLLVNIILFIKQHITFYGAGTREECPAPTAAWMG